MSRQTANEWWAGQGLHSAHLKEAGFADTMKRLWDAYRKKHPGSKKPPQSLVDEAKSKSEGPKKEAPKKEDANSHQSEYHTKKKHLDSKIDQHQKDLDKHTRALEEIEKDPSKGKAYDDSRHGPDGEEHYRVDPKGEATEGKKKSEKALADAKAELKEHTKEDADTYAKRKDSESKSQTEKEKSRRKSLSQKERDAEDGEETKRVNRDYYGDEEGHANLKFDKKGGLASNRFEKKEIKMNRKAALAELVKLASGCGCGGGDTKTSRFEEGVSADPTKNMSEEDADTWWAKHEEHKDNFKTAGGGSGVTLCLSGKGKNIRALKPETSGWHPVGVRGVMGIRIPVENLTIQSYEDSATIRKAGVLTLESSDLPTDFDSIANHGGTAVSVISMDNVTLSAGFSRGRAPTEVEVTGTLETDDGFDYSFEGTLTTSPSFREAWDSLDQNYGEEDEEIGFGNDFLTRNRFASTGKIAARSLSDIAMEIRRDWRPVNFAAKPYLDSMSGLDSIHDSDGYDSAKSIVLYFLNNAGSWRGEVAKRVKAELKAMVSGGAVKPKARPLQMPWGRD